MSELFNKRENLLQDVNNKQEIVIKKM